ncbi:MULTISPECIES: hypothetical protein [Actinomycetes]|uniref:Uncharacterized protein n=2 Tax=Actinomycetes TaxID=1760 RepID=A0ABP6LTL9_9MICC
MALASAGLHLLMIGHGGLLWSAVMTTMALACVPCAVHLWRREAILSWRLIGLMNGLMVVVHLILFGDPSAVAPWESAGQGGGHPLHGGSHHPEVHAAQYGGGGPSHVVLVGATVLALAEVLLATWRGWLQGWVRRWARGIRGVRS